MDQDRQCTFTSNRAWYASLAAETGIIAEPSDCDHEDQLFAYVADRPDRLLVFGEENSCTLVIEGEDGGGCLLDVSCPLD